MSAATSSVGQAGPRYKHRPGKGHKTPTKSPILHCGLLIIHGLFYLFCMVRNTLRTIHDTLTGFLLTSSSKELIKSDISTLNKLPSHLAVIVSEHDLEKLASDVADLAAWTICSSIPVLTIYESKGELKGLESSLQVAIKRKIRRYFRDTKKIIINTPAWGLSSNNYGDDDSSIPDLEINIISREDGREAILDLTRSLCNLVHSSDRVRVANNFKEDTKPIANGKPTNGHNPRVQGLLTSSETSKSKMFSTYRGLSGPFHPGVSKVEEMATTLCSADITIPFLDAHLCNSTIAEPNLLLIFSTEQALDGFPPWSMRLCEICYVGGTGRVHYQGFIRGLQQYGQAEMRFGH